MKAGRLVAALEVLYLAEDGLFVNAVPVREGLARVNARRPLVRLDELKRAEQEARAARRGIWRDAP